MKISRASRPRLAPKARYRWDRHSKKHILLYPERGLVLNGSAAEILGLCDGARTVEEIARTLAARTSGTHETIEADVLAFLDTMHKRALVIDG